MTEKTGFWSSMWTQIKSIGNLGDSIDVVAADRAIRSNIYFRGPNIWILAFAIVLASVGLNVNSTAVIIGAMLVSPLMGPIFGLGLGLGTNDMILLKESAKNLLVMVGISLFASFIYFVITPLEIANPTELLARTNPTIYDVFIALFGGFAGIFELSRKEKGTVFSGVAIATALMPPLCTAGYGLASGNFIYFAGAIYLFLINCIFIMLATYITVRYLHFAQKTYETAERKKKSKRIITALIVIIIVPSIFSAISMVKENQFEQNVQKFVGANRTIGKSYIYDYKITHRKGSKVEFMVSGEMLSEELQRSFYNIAGQYGIKKKDITLSDSGYETKDNNQEIVKGIFDATEQQLAKKDNEIAMLKEKLQVINDSKIPAIQIAREISASYPFVKNVSIAKGESVNIENNSFNDCVILVVDTEVHLKETDRQRLIEGLKVRLDVSSVLLYENFIGLEEVETKIENEVEKEDAQTKIQKSDTLNTNNFSENI